MHDVPPYQFRTARHIRSSRHILEAVSYVKLCMHVSKQAFKSLAKWLKHNASAVGKSSWKEKGKENDDEEGGKGDGKGWDLAAAKKCAADFVQWLLEPSLAETSAAIGKLHGVSLHVCSQLP
jgi:hypothetical protein